MGLPPGMTLDSVPSASGLPPGMKLDAPKAAPPAASPETGTWAGIKRGVGNIVHMPGAILDAVTKPPQSADEEKMQALGGNGALAIHRLIAVPMAQQRELANQYQQQATGNAQTPPEKFGFDFSLTGSTPQEKAQHLANLHKIASAVPVLGPMVSDMTERFLGIGAHEGNPDKSGAVAEGATYVAAPKVAEGILKGAPVAAKAAADVLPESVKNYTPSGNIPGLAKRFVAGQTVGRLPGASLVELTGSNALTRPTLAEWVKALLPSKQLSLFKTMPKLGDMPISPETHPATFAVLEGKEPTPAAAPTQPTNMEGYYGKYAGKSNLNANQRQLASPTAAASPNPTVPKQQVTFVPKAEPTAEDLQFQDQNLAAILQATLGQLRLVKK